MLENQTNLLYSIQKLFLLNIIIYSLSRIHDRYCGWMVGELATQTLVILLLKEPQQLMYPGVSGFAMVLRYVHTLPVLHCKSIGTPVQPQVNSQHPVSSCLLSLEWWWFIRFAPLIRTALRTP